MFHTSKINAYIIKRKAETKDEKREMGVEIREKERGKKRKEEKRNEEKRENSSTKTTDSIHEESRRLC